MKARELPDNKGFNNGDKPEKPSVPYVDMSVNAINRNGYEPNAKTSGIKIRGTGAATKGKMARGPMA